MKLKILEFLDTILGSFKYVMMYLAGAIVATSGDGIMKDWLIASGIIMGIYLVLGIIWIGFWVSLDDENTYVYEKEKLLEDITRLDVKDNDLVDYKIIGDSFKVELRCPRPYFESVKPLLEEFAEEMLDAECADSDEEA